MLFEVLVILALVLLNGVFAAAEIAVISLRGSRLETLVASGSRRARAVKRLRENPERFLATVQIGVTVVGVVASAFGGVTLATRLQGTLTGIPALASHAESIALSAVVGVISYLSLVIGELVPKSLALRYGERYALLVAQPLLGLSWLARPVVWSLTKSSNVVLRLFNDSTTFTESRLSSEEIQQLVEDAAASGSVDPHAGRMASRVFDLAGLSVAKVMVPRHRVVAVPRTATYADVRRVLARAGHTRMPVYDGSLDDVIGYINVKDLITRGPPSAADGLDDVVRPAFFVVETMAAVDLIEEMKRRRVQFAVVVDELGTTSGIVSLEDLVEEIVGEVSSEHEVTAPHLLRAEADGSFVVLGDAPVHEVNRRLDLGLPEGESWATMAGLCIELAGHIPAVGDRLRTAQGVELEITEASDRRVRAVRLRRPPSDA